MDTLRDMETTVMELIIFSGESRSCAMEALQAARKKEWQQAEVLLVQSTQAGKRAHQIQTELIGADEGCGKIPVNLIMVHAQDHLMNSLLCREMAEEMIYLHKEIDGLRQSR